MQIEGKVGELLEWDYFVKDIVSTNSLELDILIKTPSGKEYIVPTFWRGDNRFSVRFIAREIGRYEVKLKSNINLLNSVVDSLLISQGVVFKPLKLSDNKKYLQKGDKPFFWLSDTWWMALSSRLDFELFKQMADFRKSQGFNIIQLVAGLMPDMDSFDTRGANKSGFPWEENYSKINPHYFDEADEKIFYLFNSGFTISIVGSWGYYLNFLGEEKMKQHWRYLIARWGALDVIWCIAGETTMPYYLSNNRNLEQKELKSGWSELAKYIREIESFGRLITTHPIEASVNELDSDLLDINLLQASHNSFSSIQKGIELLERSINLNIPTIMDEINYEGILRGNESSMQRVSFWNSFLNGSKGFGYGANGIWQVNKEDNPFGASPSGASWGNTPLKKALYFQGAKDISRAKKFLEEFEWWNLEPKSSDIKPIPKPIYNISMAGFNKNLRIIYIYEQIPPWHNIEYKITKLNANALYNAYFWNPSFEQKINIEPIKSSNSGEITLPLPPSLDEWVLVLEFEKKKRNSTSVSTKTKFKNKVSEFIKKAFTF